MRKFKVDEWVWYHQFPDAVSDILKEPKRAVILDLLENGKYSIYIDDPKTDEKWRWKEVNEENLKAID